MRAFPEAAIRIRLGKVGWVIANAFLCAALAFVQVLLGGDLSSSAMFAGATFFGFLAVLEANVTTALGILNLLLVGRFLLGAYVTKNLLMGESITARMSAPEETAAVMLLGFAGVWAGTAAVCRNVRSLPQFRVRVDPRNLLVLSLVFFIVGGISSIAVRIVGADDAVGGVWGIAKSIAPMRILALPALMLYLWSTDSRRWLTHPMVLSCALLLLVLGVLSSSKQNMAEPLVIYFLMAVARYGWRHPVAWMSIPLTIAIFQFFIFPIGQYARQAGAEHKNAREAAIATADITWGYLTDSAYRAYIQRFVTGSDRTEKPLSYLGEDIGAYGRLAMIGEADRLVSATKMYGYTGWETIRDALLLQVPYFLYPNKPQLGTNNFLGRYTGDLRPEDMSTQVSYGFMANAYNVSGFATVFPLSVITSFFVLGLLALMASGPVYANPWSFAAVIGAHQSYVEASFSGQFSVFHAPILAVVVLLIVFLVEWVLRQVTPKGIQSPVALLR
jgi:hypothetical protein